MIFAVYVLVVLIGLVCWLTALYDLDRRRCATARGAGDLDDE